MTKVLTSRQRARRDEKILNLYYKKNMSTRQIAERVGLSKTRVHEIIAYEN
jgi:DNA-binding transcriptional regulator LsrR (DeoR family)